jgi:hypothetical protein
VSNDRRWLEARIAAVERLWGPRSWTRDDGISTHRRQIGLRGLGGLSAEIECDQFLDLGEAWWHEMPLSFCPPSTSAQSDDWARRWTGGLLTTCGLSAVGPAPAADGGMHGRATLIPASVTRRGGCWVGDEYELVVTGLMREGAIFQQNITVERTIRARIGRSEIRIQDVVRNEGFAQDTVRLLYHVNLGWPMIEEGALIEASAQATQGGSEGGDWRARVTQPSTRGHEIVDGLLAVADGGGWTRAQVTAPKGPRFSVLWRPEQLGYLTIWRSPLAGSYAVGIEPGTCWPSHVEGPEYGKAGHSLEPGQFFVVDLRLQIDGPAFNVEQRSSSSA